jgi:superoxide dismutase, Fe-Mn family
LVMDIFEHAFITDYNMDRAAYIDAFVNAIDWNVVQDRFNKTQD